MIRRLFVWWFKRKGFTMYNDVPPEVKKYVLIAAPHTSNWDFVYALACFDGLGIPIRFTIKQEWLRWPFKYWMEGFGAIGIDRSPRSDGNRPSQTEAMTELFNNREELVVLVTPEGTRSKREKWKTGFYHVAQNAGVPVVLAYLDYKKKEVGITGMFHPSGDIEADLSKVMAFYDGITPRFPEKYSGDKRYC